MNEPPFTPEQFVRAWIVVMVSTIAGAAIYRKAQRLPFFRPRFPDAERQENWRTVASSIGLMGRFVQANNFGWFVLTRDALHVGAHFPLNMFIPRFLSALDLTIPIAAMKAVSMESARGQSYLCVQYEVVTDEAQRITSTAEVDLWPTAPERLLFTLNEKIREARQRR
jgi:hypothetical protein